MPSSSDGAAGATLFRKFTTRSTTGVPTTLSGTPAISIYKDGSTTESTTGVTLTVDFDARTGLNHVAIDTSTDTSFYVNGSYYVLVITAGTVSSVSVIGEVVGNFTLGAGTIRTGLAQAGAAGTITLDSGASATDNLYADQIVQLVSGTGAGQCRLVLSYVGSTKVATVTPNWATNPDSTSQFTLLPFSRTDLAAILGTVSPATAGYMGPDWGHVNAPTSTLNLSGTTVGNLTTNLDKSNYTLSSSGLNNVVIETGCDARQAICIIAAACAGLSSGVDTGLPVYKGLGVSTTRISATASAGNRSVVTLTLP